MKVEGPKSTSSVQLRRTRKAGSTSSSGEFAAELDKVTGGADSAGEAGAVEHSGAVSGVGGLLAAQTVGGESGPSYEERQKRAKRGAEILDRLEEVRRGLLAGVIPKDRLAELARIVREKRERGADPVISRLLDEIELRAEVELAKLSPRTS